MSLSFDMYRQARDTAAANGAPSFQFNGRTYRKVNDDSKIVKYRGTKKSSKKKKRKSNKKSRK